LLEPVELLEEDVAPFDAVASVAEPFAAELLELLAAEAPPLVAAFSSAAISASTTATCEATSCASVALAAVFDASSVANSFSRDTSCFCKAAICAALLLELLDPTAETIMLLLTLRADSMSALNLCNGGVPQCLRAGCRKNR
jgi:hypothetical protein